MKGSAIAWIAAGVGVGVVYLLSKRASAAPADAQVSVGTGSMPPAATLTGTGNLPAGTKEHQVSLYNRDRDYVAWLEKRAKETLEQAESVAPPPPATKEVVTTVPISATALPTFSTSVVKLGMGLIPTVTSDNLTLTFSSAASAIPIAVLPKEPVRVIMAPKLSMLRRT